MISSSAASIVGNLTPKVRSSSKNECTGNQATKKGNNKKESSSNFECNICFETASNAVISMCGHLFCWPCLYQWLETRTTAQLCPVCRSIISTEKVIPLYGRGDTEQEDPRFKVPPRPLPQRTDPDQEEELEGSYFIITLFHVPTEIETYQLDVALNSEGNRSTSLESITEEDEQELEIILQIFETVQE